MGLNVAMQVFRGPRANIANLASTGNAGVLAWTTDSYELFVDRGTGNAGIGFGNSWQKISNDISVFTAANQSAQTSLTGVQIGDVCLRTDQNLTYICTGFPSSSFSNWSAIAVTSGSTIQGLSGPTANEWVSYIDASGVQHLSQPAFANISGVLSQSQLPASIGVGSNLTSFDCGTF